LSCLVNVRGDNEEELTVKMKEKIEQSKDVIRNKLKQWITEF
jgi:hypothetical protein